MNDIGFAHSLPEAEAAYSQWHIVAYMCVCIHTLYAYEFISAFREIMSLWTYHQVHCDRRHTEFDCYEYEVECLRNSYVYKGDSW